MAKYNPHDIPPKGHILAKVVSPDDTFELQWIGPENIDHENCTPKCHLTKEQRERIERVRWAMREHDTMRLEQWFFNFSCDMHPDREIAIWEAIAKTYREELALRPACGPRVRALLNDVLVRGSLLETVDQLLALHPHLKGLTNLGRVFDSLHAKLRD